MQQHQIDRSSGGQPVYRQLRKIIKEEIRQFYMTGDLLPSEQSLALRFKVNRHTVRRAMEELINAGYINRVHGKGTFVLRPSVDYAIHPSTRFTETLESQGRRTVSRVLSNNRSMAHGKVANKLDLPQGAPIIRLDTMRIVDTCPFCVSEHYFPSPEFDFILNDYQGGSLHRFIYGCSKKRLRRVTSLVTAAAATEEDACTLNLPVGLPILKVKSVNVDRGNGQPLEYVITRFRSDAIQLSIKP